MPFFKEAREHYIDTFRHARNTDEIGFLRPNPETNYKLSPLTKDVNFDVYVRGGKGPEKEAVLRLWDLVEITERPTLLWNTREGPYPILDHSILLAEYKVSKQRAEEARMHRLEEERQARLIQQTMANQQRSTPRDAALDQTAQAVPAVLDRQALFEQRSQYLQHPRPHDISIELEDYLIGLIQLVNQQTSNAQQSARPTPQKLSFLQPEQPIKSMFSDSAKASGIGDFLFENGRVIAAILIPAFVVIVLLIAVLTFPTGNPPNVAPEIVPILNDIQPRNGVSTQGIGEGKTLIKPSGIAGPEASD